MSRIACFAVLLVLALSFGTGTGYIVGQYRSGVYKDPNHGPAAARAFIAAHAIQDSSGRYIAICDEEAVVYDAISKTVVERRQARREELHFDMARLARRPVPYTASVGLLGGAVVTAPKVFDAFSRVWSKTESFGDRAGVAAGTLASAITGFGFGYWLGFDRYPGCREKVFHGEFKSAEAFKKMPFSVASPMDHAAKQATPQPLLGD